MEDKLQYIADTLGAEELLCQLAEEAAALSQAALKLRRAIDGKNPTPKTCSECIDNLLEEHADIELCLMVLFISNSISEMQDFSDEYNSSLEKKLNRWLKRLKEKESKTLQERRVDFGEPTAI